MLFTQLPTVCYCHWLWPDCVSDRPSPHPSGIHILVEDTDKQMTMQWGNLVTVGDKMPWEQEARTPNPNCTFQRRQCERRENQQAREARLRGPALQEAKCEKHLHRASRAGKGQGAAAWEGKEEEDQVKSDRPLRDRASQSCPLDFHQLLKQQQNRVWLHVRRNTSESITVLKMFPGLKSPGEALRARQGGGCWWP